MKYKTPPRRFRAGLGSRDKFLFNARDLLGGDVVNRFKQAIYKIGINPVVDPPDRVLTILFEEAGRAKGPLPVCGTINGAPFIQTLVKYRGAWRLYINGMMLKAGAVAVGDVAEIEIEFDPRPRTFDMPATLAAAFEQDAAVKEAFEQLTPSRRKEMLRYLDSLKTEAAIERNVQR